MTIQEMGNKGKEWLLSALRGDFFVALVIVLVGIGAFGLGRLSVKAEKEAVRVSLASGEVGSEKALEASKNVENSLKKALSTPAHASTDSSGEGKFVASKNGSVYYLPSCSGATRIKDENKVWFDSVDAAEGAGYHKAANCKGL